MSTANAACVWDFSLRTSQSTWTATQRALIAISTGLPLSCKAWSFQLEEGTESELLHFQGRISLKLKQRLGKVRTVILAALGEAEPEFRDSLHLSLTSSANRDNSFYVNKLEGRVSGPWSDPSQVLRTEPEDIRQISLWSWQETIASYSAKSVDTRHINVLVCPHGGIGKSTLVKKLAFLGVARVVPTTIGKADDLMQWVMSFPPCTLYLYDLPRSVDQSRLKELYAAIEVVKGGYAYDKRYKGKEMWFTCPHIWVFCNEKPKTEWLSEDRWVFWTVENMELVRLE